MTIKQKQNLSPSTTRFHNIPNICVRQNKIHLKVKLEKNEKTTRKLKHLTNTKKQVRTLNSNKNISILKQGKGSGVFILNRRNYIKKTCKYLIVTSAKD